MLNRVCTISGHGITARKISKRATTQKGSAMRQDMKVVFVCFWLVTAIVACAQSVERQPNAQWWISPQDSPLRFSSTTERYLDVINVSQEIVISHTLGCIVETKNGYLLTKRFTPRKGEMKPNGGALIDSKSWYERVYLAECKTPASKLAIIEVKFANGKEWNLPLAEKH
jgi:hypothetical protein